MPFRVHYGADTWVPDGWENFDATPSLFVQNIPVFGKNLSPIRFPKSVRFGNIEKGLPIADGSADTVYCLLILEHLAVEDLRKALRNTLKIFRPRRIYRLVIPDLRSSAEAYIKITDPGAGFWFIEQSRLGQMNR